MSDFISGMTARGSVDGGELVEASVLSPTVTITATTISAAASDNSYNDSGSGFVAAGFAVGDRVKVTGFTGDTANNIFAATITALTTAKMTIGGTDGDVIVDDAAGESVTISKWITERMTAQQVANLAAATGHVIEDEGTPLTTRSSLNFVGAGVTATDDSGNDATVVTIPGGGGAGVAVQGSEVIADITPDNTVDSYTIDVTGYSNVRVHAQGITVGSSSSIQLELSDDGGTSAVSLIRNFVRDGDMKGGQSDSSIDMGSSDTTFHSSVDLTDLAIAAPAKSIAVSDHGTSTAFVMSYQQVGVAIINAVKFSSPVNLTGGRLVVTGEKHTDKLYAAVSDPSVVTLGEFTATGSESSYDLSGLDLSEYDRVEIIHSLRNSGAGTTLGLRFNNDSAGNYKHQGIIGAGGTSVNGIATNADNEIEVHMVGSGGSANHYGYGIIDIPEPSNTTRYKNTFSRDSRIPDSTVGNFRQDLVAGLWANTAAITRLTLFTVDTNNFVAGSTIKVLGIKGSAAAPTLLSGTTFPSGPGDKQRFFHETYEEEFYWDAGESLWLGEEKPISFNLLAATVTSIASGVVPHRASLGIFVTKIESTMLIAGTGDWTTTLGWRNAADSETVLHTQNSTSGSWVDSVTAINAALDATARVLTMTVTENSGTASCFAGATAYYRRIGV